MTTFTRSADAARTAVALDEMIRDHRQHVLLDACRDLAPPGWTDQAEATAEHLRDGWLRATAHRRADVTYRTARWGRYPTWVTLGIMTTITEWAAEVGSTCTHAPTATRPQPVHAAAWRPGLVACGRCIFLLNLPRGAAAESLCDGCGHQCAGVDDGDPIWSSVIVAGVLTYSVGVCRSCRWWTDQ